MKRFYHPFLKNTKLTTSEGTFDLDENGSVEVEDKVFDEFMKVPHNAEHQAKLDDKNAVVPTLEEFVKAGYKAENYEYRFCGFKAGEVLDEEAIKKNQGEFDRQKNEGLKREDLELLELPELKAIAKERKIPFQKNISKDDLVTALAAEEPPPPPHHTDPPEES